MTPCALHKTHKPLNHTVEAHHIIPRAWQATWHPASQPFPGEAADGQRLWDVRTAVLCPTGHRNVHFWIVTLMQKADEAMSRGSDNSLRDAIKLTKDDFHIRSGAEFNMATLALSRFIEVGGDLKTLIDAHEWGQI